MDHLIVKDATVDELAEGLQVSVELRCLPTCIAYATRIAYAHLLSGGLPAYVQQTGFATRGPTTSVPYVDTAVGPKIPPNNLDERILRVPNVLRMGAQHMQPSPFGAMCLLKAQCIPSQPSPHEVA